MPTYTSHGRAKQISPSVRISLRTCASVFQNRREELFRRSEVPGKAHAAAMKSKTLLDSVSVGAMNTLVLSDLHLGEDLAPTATEAARLHVDIVERQLVQFLRLYTRRREGGRPWRLVFNGDLIDILTIVIGPDHPDFPLLSGRPASP